MVLSLVLVVLLGSLSSCCGVKKTRSKIVRTLDTTIVYEPPSFKTEIKDISHIPIREVVEGGTVTVYKEGETIFVECDPEEQKEDVQIEEVYKGKTLTRDGSKWWWFFLMGLCVPYIIRILKWLNV